MSDPQSDRVRAVSKRLPDWHVWRAYDAETGKTLGVRVARKGESASGAFKALVLKSSTTIAFEKRATINRCTKEQAIDVMHALNPDVLGRPN